MIKEICARGSVEYRKEHGRRNREIISSAMALIEEIRMAVLLGITKYNLVSTPEFRGIALCISIAGDEVKAHSWFDI